MSKKENKPKVKGIKYLPKPKHAEEYSSREGNAFQPWKVDLAIQMAEHEKEPVTYTVFCRANSPDSAQQMAYRGFVYWVYNKQDPNPWQYPNIAFDGGKHVAYRITEQDWDEFLKKGKRTEGFRSNRGSIVFVFHYMEEKDKEAIRRIHKRQTTIIKPNLAAINEVTKSKNIK